MVEIFNKFFNFMMGIKRKAREQKIKKWKYTKGVKTNINRSEKEGKMNERINSKKMNKKKVEKGNEENTHE